MNGYKILRLRIQLDETQIWRSFEINANVNFGYLHEVIQAIMGWQNYHLYEFKIGEQSILPEEEGYENPPSKYNNETALKKALTKKGQKFKYIYDFGDCWVHTIEVEDIINYTFEDIAKEYIEGAARKFPQCIDGAKNVLPKMLVVLMPILDLLSQ